MITIINNNEIRTKKVTGLVRESFDSDKFREFIQTIGTVVSDKDIFKLIKDGTATVVGVVDKSDSGLEVDLVVKCFKSGGVLKTTARRFTGSKAKSLFVKNSLLFEEGFNVSEPIAFINLFKSIESCFISTNLKECKNFALEYNRLISESPEGLATSIADEMNLWHNRGIVHGDMKWSNIMVDLNDGIKPYFIDLDQVSIGKSVDIKGVMDDLTRFYRYGLELSVEDWTYNVFMPAYMDGSASRIKDSLSIDNIALRAMAEHKLKN